MSIRNRLRIYLIADFTDRSETTVIKAVQQALEGGVMTVQYRDKSELSHKRRLKRAQRIKALAQKSGALFIVNDFLGLALEVEADGVHLGPTDLDPEVARQQSPVDFIIGGSAGTVDRAVQLESSGVDYLGVGAIFDAKQTKPDASHPRGPEVIRTISRQIRIPIVAIGGIGPHNVERVFAAGADGVAVVRSVLDSDDPARAVAEILAAWRRTKGFVEGEAE